MPRQQGKKPGKKKMSVPVMVLLDMLCIAVGLLVFAWFHHVRDAYFPSGTVNTDPVVLITPTPVITATPTPEPVTDTHVEEPVHEYSGMWGAKFADKFTDGEIIRTDTSYISENVNVTLTHVEQQKLNYHIADIYVSDIKYLRSAFGQKGYGSRSLTADISADNNAIVAISGDYYSARKEGIVVRNGVLYRETRFQDVCILLRDGRMITLANKDVDLEQLREAAPWQVWSFGPMLLENGKAMTSFTSDVVRKNPRSAIGYVEPGHYYFVQVDGRGGYGSSGMTMTELAKLFEELGCETAYNLDGGQTAGITWYGELISFPYGRSVSDIIYITDSPDDMEG